jgi:hypothetical protein
MVFLSLPENHLTLNGLVHGGPISFQGPGFVLNYPHAGSVSAPSSRATLLVQQDFDSDLWGFRLGPYVD